MGRQWSHLLGLVNLVLEREMGRVLCRTSSHILDLVVLDSRYVGENLHPISLPSVNVTPPFILILLMRLQGKLFLKDMLSVLSAVLHDHQSFLSYKVTSPFTSSRKTELKQSATKYSADYWLVSQTQGELAVVQLGHSNAASDGAITHYQLCRL